MSEPIKPSKVAGFKKAAIPPQVIDAFNELIAKNIDGNSAVVGQEEVVTLILAKIRAACGAEKERDVYDNRWLDVEDICRKAGWKVEYDKPGYSENYEPTFKFTRPVMRGG